MNTLSWTSPYGSKGLGRFALQVKGGRYLLIDGEWYLKTRDGMKHDQSHARWMRRSWLRLTCTTTSKNCAQTVYNPYVIPVLVFPDMEADPAIEQLARRAGVYLVWRTDNLMADLEQIVRRRGVPASLTMERIGREVYAVTDGLIQLAEAGRAGTRAKAVRPIALSLSVGGRTVFRFAAQEMHLRFGTVIGPGASQKGSGGRRR